MMFPCVVLIALVSAAPGGPLGEKAAAESSHRAAAREFYMAAGGARMAELSVEAMMPVVRGNPGLAPYEDIFHGWAIKLVGSPDVVDEFVRLYAEAFSEEELRQLTAFYSSPTGRKAVSQLPVIIQKGKEVGEAKAREHMPELFRLIEERKKEQKAPASASPSSQIEKGTIGR